MAERAVRKKLSGTPCENVLDVRTAGILDQTG